MSDTGALQKLPSEILSEQIVQILVEHKLLLPADAKKTQTSLAGGKLKADDWRLVIEKALDKESVNG